MIDFQTRLIFPTHAVRNAGPLPPGAETLSLKVRGANLEGVYLPPDKAPAERTLILGFGGNGWNGQDVGEYLHEIYPDADVIAFHYRGYRPSTGAPSADALVADAPLVYDLAVNRVKPRRTIAVGFSIGTGIAAQLASRRKLDGLILVTPFDSLKAVAQSMYPWLPIGIFFQHEVEAAAPLAKVKVPVAIIEAERDELVPHERTEALRKRVPRIVFDETIRRAGHNDIYTRSDFHDAMRNALEAVSG